MRSFLFFIATILLSCLGFATDNLHAWQKKLDDVGVRFNKNKTQMLVFTPNRISKWNLETGELTASYDTYAQDLQSNLHRNAKLIDADELLTELIIQDANGVYHRFSFLYGGYINFPKLPTSPRIFHGYVNGNNIVYTTQGDYNVAVYDQNTRNEKIVHKKYYGYVQVPKDHKGIIIRDNDEFHFVDGETLKKSKLGIKNRFSDHKYLPDHWIRAYSKKEGNKTRVQFVNYDTKEKEVYKDEEALNILYPKSVPQPQTDFKRAIVYADDEHYFQIQFAEKYQDGNSTYYQYLITQLEIATNKQVKTFNISSSKVDFLKYHEEAKARESIEFKEFLINFEPLPWRYSFDYNKAGGREIQSIPFVRNKIHPSKGDREFAIGRLMNCSNGKVAVLSISFTEYSNGQVSHFFIHEYDIDGNLLASHDMGKTTRSTTGVTELTEFSINSNLDSYRANAKWTFANKAPLVKNYVGNCN